jgi:D-alanyl-D-alanine carboxypeptidase
VPGCDGLKTGYFRAGGFSITATAERDGVRIIAVVMGCRSSKTRDQWAGRLLERGFVRANTP